jgi:drug/metabolite transporter (DMT)-like permease
MSGRAWIAFAAVSLVWGVPYLFIKIAVDGGMPAIALAWARIGLGAAMLLLFARFAGTLPSLRGRWRWLAVFAVVEFVFPFPLIAAGEETIDSGTAAILIATAPLVVAMLALRFEPAERVDGRRLTGLLIGLAGVVALVGIDLGSEAGQLLGIAAVLAAAVGYAIGAMLLKRHLSDLDPAASMGASLGIAAAVLTPLALLTLPSASPSGGALASVAVLGLLCTGAAMVLMAVLVREAGPGRALVVTYVNPVIAVGLGVIFLGESPGAGAVAGLLLILAGSWLSTDGRLPPGLRARLTTPAHARRRRTHFAGRRPRSAKWRRHSASLRPTPARSGTHRSYTRVVRRALMRLLGGTNRLPGRWRPQPPARSASSSPSPASTVTTAAPRSSPAPCATPAWR